MATAEVTLRQNDVSMQDEPEIASRADVGHWGSRKYRLTLLFALTAVAVIVLAAYIANRVIGNLAENHLISMAQENTARDAEHIQSMMRNMGDFKSMSGMSSAHATESGNTMEEMQQHMPMSLEFLASPEGLPNNYHHLVEGLNIVETILFDPNGFAVWSTDVANLDKTKPKRKDWELYTILAKVPAGDYRG